MLCDSEDDWPGCECPEPDRNAVRDAAKLVTALAPIVVAALKYGPQLWQFFAARLREPPPPRRRKPKPKP